MPKFNVTMFTTIYKTVTVDAETAEEAGAKVYADNPIDLSCLPDGVTVDEDWVNIEPDGGNATARIVTVDWDVDDELERPDLPDTVEIPGDVPEDDIADWLSDKFGYCVNEFFIN